MDQLAEYLNSVQGPIDTDKSTADFLQHSLGLLATMTRFSASTLKRYKLQSNPVSLSCVLKVYFAYQLYPQTGCVDYSQVCIDEFYAVIGQPVIA